MALMNNTFAMQPRPETILVASANSALASGTLINTATGAINLTDGQLGLLSAKHGQGVAYNTFLTAGQTVANARFVRLVQGTPNSGNVSDSNGTPGQHLPYVQSPIIDGKSAITVTGKVAAAPSYSAWVIGDVAANAGAIAVSDETEYLMHVGFTGVRNDREFSVSGIETLSVSYTTPNYTSLGTTNSRDHLLKNVAYSVNKSSRMLGIRQAGAQHGNRNIIALAVNLAGGAGSLTGNSVTTAGSQSTAVVDLQTGSGNPVASLPVYYDGSTTYSITVDDTLRETFDNLVANTVLAAASTIEVINLATAGSAAAGAGTLSADAIILIGTDSVLAQVNDTEERIKTRIHVGLEYNYNSLSPNKQEGSNAYEGAGSGRVWQLRSDRYHKVNQYTQQTLPYMEDFIQVPDYVDPTKNYNVYIIENIQENNVNYSHTAYNPNRTILLVENTSTLGTGLASVVTSLNAIVDPWLDSAEVEFGLKAGGANYFA